jgi:hypothetical protein
VSKVKILGYVVVWVVLMVATALEMLIFGMPAPPSVTTLGIGGLAGLKGLLIALFYQHVVDEPKSVSLLYLAALLAAAGLLIGMAVSY